MGKKHIAEDEPQDTEGNSIKVHGVSDGADDTEGNYGIRLSDAEIKHDVTPLAEPKAETEDTEGNALKVEN